MALLPYQHPDNHAGAQIIVIYPPLGALMKKFFRIIM
jgi:hypothetical protein